MNNIKQPQLVIGFLTYGQATAVYLPYFLSSLKQQTFTDFVILALDNSQESDNENSKLLANDLEVDYQWAGKNLGFAGGNNVLIKKAKAMGAKYFLALNPDIILEADAINYLVKVLESNEKLGSVTSKVLRWDFINKQKTKIIDSCGIVRTTGLRFVDLGQGQLDQGQYDQAEILGPSGCMAMYRLSALEDIKEQEQYFDQAFFMYKEDIDLAYRLKIAGWRSKLVSRAVVYHDRTVTSQGKSLNKIVSDRQNKSLLNKQYSFLGQLILYYKYWHLQNIWQRIIMISQLKMILFYSLLFERYLLKQIFVFFKIKSSLKQYK